MVTNSEFTHIAMVLKFAKNPTELLYVDATGANGVAVNRWSNMRKHIGPKKLYSKCVFRHEVQR